MATPNHTLMSLRIAGLTTAAADADALKLQEIFKKLFSEAGGGVDWTWDTVGGTGQGRGAAPNRFSLSGKPAAFNDAMIIGGILVEGNFERTTLRTGGGSLFVELRGGYYHKIPGQEGEGKFDRSTAADLGEHLVKLPDYEYSGRVDGQPFSATMDELKVMIKEVADYPPAYALSQSKPAIQKRMQDKTYQEMSKQKVEQKQSDVEQYQDVSILADLVRADGDDTFGPADVNRMLELRGQKSTPELYRALRAELEGLGLTFDRSKKLGMSLRTAAVLSEIDGMLAAMSA
jgi:hypothetical protein